MDSCVFILYSTSNLHALVDRFLVINDCIFCHAWFGMIIYVIEKIYLKRSIFDFVSHSGERYSRLPLSELVSL